MMGMKEIRRVEPEDHESAARLLQQFFAEEGFATPPDLIRPRLDLMLADKANAAFLAWDGDRAVGVATVTTSRGIELGRSAEMDDLYVRPEARGSGIATRLIAAVRAWCQEHDVSVLSIVVTPEAQEAHDLVAFYRKQGFDDTGRKLLSTQLPASSKA